MRFLKQEYQEDKNDLVITDTELKQVAYIFKCNKSTLQMKGKINSITIGEWTVSHMSFGAVSPGKICTCR